jgi:hypothetical protein
LTETPTINPTQKPIVNSTSPSKSPTISNPTNEPSVSPTEILNQLNLTFTNNYEEVCGNLKTLFLQECSKAIHNLGFRNVYCIDVNSGSIIITLEGPQNEITSVSHFIMKSKGLLIPDIALLILKEDVKIMKGEDEEVNSSFMHEYSNLIMACLIFVMMIIIMALYLCYSSLCKNHSSVIVKDKKLELSSDVEITGAAAIMTMSSIESLRDENRQKRTPIVPNWSSEGEQQPGEVSFPTVLVTLME